MKQEPIAVVGMGAMLPDAPDVEASWRLITQKHSAIRTVPASRWDAHLYYDPERKSDYTTNSIIGSFLPDDIGFSTKLFGMPPIMKDHLDPTQQLALLVAKQALEDAGLKERSPRNWAVSVGNLLGGSWKRGEQWLRTQHIQTRKQLTDNPIYQSLPAHQQQSLQEAISLRLPWSDQPVMTPDSLPGLLGNLIASRISHYYNLTGPNFTIDAACATSLAAIEQAVMGLRLHKYDAALAGGVDRIMDASSFIGFSKMGVLSPDGSRPFDAKANGFVMGEGCVFFVLKRLTDALANDDKIYSVILGIGSSTDGQGRAIAAPNPDGQSLAIQRAYKDANVSPETIDSIECHGTSTPIGDPSELTGLHTVWSQTNRTDPVSIGSIKSNLGHLKGAAGAAAMLKSILGLHHQMLLPQVNFETPNPHFDWDASPFVVQTEVAPWPAPKDHPRRSGVSAFGFGGINYHVVLEEPPASHQPTRFPLVPLTTGATNMNQDTSIPSLPLDQPILAIGATDKADMLAQVDALLQTSQNGGDALAQAQQSPLLASQPFRIAFYAPTPDKIQTQLELLKKTLEAGGSFKKLEAKGISVREGTPITGKVALMFPGQGSQYVKMMSEYSQHFPIVAETLREADEVMGNLLPKPLSAYMMPPADVDEGTAFMELLQTEVLQPAVLAADTALYRLLSPILSSDLVMGHSLGEYGAAIAAGVFSFPDALRIVAARGEAIAAVADHMDDVGVMIGVNTDADTVDALLDETRKEGDYVIVANKNCPTQTIIAGASEATMNAAKALEAKGFETIQLPVSHAFHSDIVSPASPFLRDELKKIDIQPPTCTILSNVTAEPYPTDETAPAWILDTLSVHLARPVEWQKMVELAYQDGYRYFLEIGPKRALSSFVKDILKDKPHAAYFSSHPKFGELESLGRMLSALIADGLLPYGTEQTAQTTPTLLDLPAYDTPAQAPPTIPTAPAPTQAPPTIPTPTHSAPIQPAAAPTPQIPVQPTPTPQAQWMAPPQHGYTNSYPHMPTMPAAFPTTPVIADPGFWQFLMMHGGSYLMHMIQQYQTMRAMMAPSYPMYPPTMPSMPPMQAMPTYPQAPMQPMYQTPPAPYMPPSAPQALPPAPASIHTVAPSYPAPPAPKSAAPAIPFPTQQSAPTQVNMPAFAPTTHATPAQEDDLTQIILQVVADRTGYSIDELGLDEHLEADLGIDSIRQVEVMAEMRDRFSLPRDDQFKMSDYTTLRALIDYVDSMRTGGGKRESSTQAGDDAGVSG